MIVDNHTHVGWFMDGYHSPQEVLYIANNAGISDIVVSSTTVCAYKCMYKDIIREMSLLVSLKSNVSTHPVLWVTPYMFNGKNRYALKKFLNSGIKWCGVKIHYEAHKEWAYRKDLVEDAVCFADDLHLPVMFHTGVGACSSKKFENFIRGHQNTMFVLAHGSPYSDAISLMKDYDNCLVDTSGMVDCIVEKFVDEGMAERIIFGTDMPLAAHIEGIDNTINQIKYKMQHLRSVVGDDSFKKIMSRSPYLM